MPCIFCQIAKGEIPKEFTYEDDQMMVFPDIHPAAPLHLLLVPKRHIEDFIDLSGEKSQIWEKMRQVAQKLIKEYKLLESGYRLVLNGGEAKLISHLHWHLMGDIAVERKL